MKNITSNFKLVALTVTGLALTAVSADAQSHCNGGAYRTGITPVQGQMVTSITGIQGGFISLGVGANGVAQYGYQVTYVAPNSPAYFRGIKIGDILLSAGSHMITPAAWSYYQNRFVSSGVLSVSFLRSGKTYSAQLGLNNQPATFPVAVSGQIPTGGNTDGGPVLEPELSEVAANVAQPSVEVVPEVVVPQAADEVGEEVAGADLGTVEADPFEVAEAEATAAQALAPVVEIEEVATQEIPEANAPTVVAPETSALVAPELSSPAVDSPSAIEAPAVESTDASAVVPEVTDLEETAAPVVSEDPVAGLVKFLEDNIRLSEGADREEFAAKLAALKQLANN